MFGALDGNRILTTTFKAVDAMSPAMRSIVQQAERMRVAVSAATATRVGSAQIEGVYRNIGGQYTNSLFQGMIGGAYRGARTFSQTLRTILSTATLGAFGGVGGGGLLGGIFDSVFNIRNLVMGYVGGSAVQGMIGAHSQFEETSNAIAGMLSALGVSGTFEQGLTDSANVMNAIAVAAARLPGEAEDYIAVFRAGLPFVQAALPGGSLEDIYTFTNNLTAIGSTLGVQSDLIGRDIADMLSPGRGRASIARTQVFAAMLPFMKQVQGQANLTAESFNRLTQPKRAQLLQQTFAKLDPMLRGAAGQFSAISGALTSTSKQLVRMATGEVFNSIKGVMESLNSLFADDRGRLTAFGARIVGLSRLMGQQFAKVLTWIGHQITALPQTLNRVSARLMADPHVKMLAHIAARGVLAAQRALATPEGRRSALALGLAATGPMGAVLAPLVAFASHTRALNTTVFALLQTFNAFVGLGEFVFATFSSFNEMLGAILAGVLPGLAQGLWAVAVPVFNFAAELSGALGVVIDQVRPYLAGLGAAVGELFTAVGSLLGPLVRVLGSLFLEIADKILVALVPAFQAFVTALTWVVQKLAAMARWGGAAINTLSPPGQSAVTARDSRASVLNNIRDIITAAQAAAATAAAQSSNAARPGQQRHTPEARGGHVTNFNHNRFDITQKFAEGFDPDRVAVAFVNDIERAANQLLHSGFNPLYGIR